MDWAEDITGINEEDLRRVWKYEEKYSTVIRLVETDEVCIHNYHVYHRVLKY